jgi:hypothetical protein
MGMGGITRDLHTYLINLLHEQHIKGLLEKKYGMLDDNRSTIPMSLTHYCDAPRTSFNGRQA